MLAIWLRLIHVKLTRVRQKVGRQKEIFRRKEVTGTDAVEKEN